jgi:hypothetical protein
MEAPSKCRVCGGSRFHEGTPFEATTFMPDQRRSFLSFGPTTAPVNGFACKACGVITLKVDPTDLRAALDKAKR